MSRCSQAYPNPNPILTPPSSHTLSSPHTPPLSTQLHIQPLRVVALAFRNNLETSLYMRLCYHEFFLPPNRRQRGRQLK